MIVLKKSPDQRSGPDVHVVHCELVWQHDVLAGIRFCEGEPTATS